MSSSKVENLPKNNYFLWLKENKADIKKMYFSNYEPKIIDGKKENISNLVTKKAGEVWNSLDTTVKESYSERLKKMKENDENKKPYLSKQLCKFLGEKSGFRIHKDEVTNRINKYIKYNLSGKFKISLDKAFAELLNLNENDKVMIGDIHKQLDEHFSDTEFVEAPPPYVETEEPVTLVEKKNSGKEKKNSGKNKKETKNEPDKETKKTSTKENTSKRKAIPRSVRKKVFDTYIITEDPNKLSGKCFVECGNTITIDNFEVGHIVAHSNGGSDEIENLRPICSQCNKSMGTENLLNFKEKYGFEVEDINALVIKIEDCNKTKSLLMEDNDTLENDTKDLGSKITMLEESSACVTKINALEKEKLVQAKAEYESKRKEIEEKLLELENLFRTQELSIKETIKSNSRTIKENKSKISDFNSAVSLNNQKIELNNVKIANVNETENKYQERKQFIENQEKMEKEQLMAELEQEVKKELEREQLKQQIRDKLLSKTQTEDLITLN